MLLYKSLPQEELTKHIHYPHHIKLSPDIPYQHTNNNHRYNLSTYHNDNNKTLNKRRMFYKVNPYAQLCVPGKIYNGIKLSEKPFNVYNSLPVLTQLSKHNYDHHNKCTCVLPQLHHHHKHHHNNKHKTIYIPRQVIPTSTVSKRSTDEWWKLAKHFIHIYTFMIFLLKYTKHSLYRKLLLKNKQKYLPSNYPPLHKWLFHIFEEFWCKINEYKNYDISLTSSSLNIQRNTKIMLSLLNTFKTCLQVKLNTLSTIPKDIQLMLYDIIKDNSYQLKQYVNLYIARRLEFTVYGTLKHLNEHQHAMLMCYVFICGFVIKDVLIHHKIIFHKKRYTFSYLQSNCLQIGSVMYYIIKELFDTKVNVNCDNISLINYYRTNYLWHKQIENNIIGCGSVDNISKIDNEDDNENILLQRKTLNEFWNSNNEYINEYKVFIFEWSCTFVKMLQQKYNNNNNHQHGLTQFINRPLDKRIKIQQLKTTI